MFLDKEYLHQKKKVITCTIDFQKKQQSTLYEQQVAGMCDRSLMPCMVSYCERALERQRPPYVQDDVL